MQAWAVKEKYAVVAEAAEELPVLMPEILVSHCSAPPFFQRNMLQ